VATAWLLHVPEVTAVVVGPSRVSHLDEVRAALDLALTPQEVAELAGWFT
jgi:aryl-alcohol dehydrogenase-like predicted oxidoreductase